MSISPEEAVAIALIDYINAEPYHLNGLCFWLDDHFSHPGYEGTRAYPVYVDCLYLMVATARRLLPEFGRGVYVDWNNGPTPIRLSLAAKILNLLETGTLIYDAQAKEWATCA